VAGTSTLFSIFGFGTAVALGGAGLLLLARRRVLRHWLAFLGPALVLGVPVIVALLPPGDAMRVQLGWMANSNGHHDGVLWFWLKNTGLFIPLLLAANLRRGLLPKGLAVAFAPIWLWFVVPNIVVFHPWEWNNTHYFAFWTLFGSLLIGALLAAWSRRGSEGRLLAMGCFVVLVLAGGLDLARTIDYSRSSIRITDADGEALGRWARTTPPDARFVTAARHEHPITALAGRQVLIGFPGWVNDLGVHEWPTLVNDVTTILDHGPGTDELLDRFGIDYVVVGPLEHEQPHLADTTWWEQNGDAVFTSGAWTVYDVETPERASR
jgi:hypothetical protein